MSQTAASLCLHALPGLPEFQTGDDLGEVLGQALSAGDLDPGPGDVLVVAQKIVSKAEGRLMDLAGVVVSERARRLAELCDKPPGLVELILQESREILTWRPGLLITVHRLGMVMANAGIDRSNVEGGDMALLLPEDPDASAARLRRALKQSLGIDLGVVISDSVGRPWRLGTLGMAIGASGVPVLKDLRGRHDRQGRVLETSETADADALAAAAVLLMGETTEGRPAVLIQGAQARDTGQVAEDLIRPPAEDLFRPASPQTDDS